MLPLLDVGVPWFLIFFATPIVEMYILLEVGGEIGALPTIGLVMLTAVIGVALLKRQGLSTLTRGIERVDHGELPASEIVEGVLLAVAGALLLTPGFVTDGIGFFLLFPPGRAWVAAHVLQRAVVIGDAQRRPHPQGDPRVIDGEFETRPSSDSDR